MRNKRTASFKDCLLVLLAIPLAWSYGGLAALEPRPALAMPAGPDDVVNTEVILENGYKITFDGAEFHTDGSSTWAYLVEELPGAKDLDYWVIEISTCMEILGADPFPWSIIAQDPRTLMTGVKWDVVKGFTQGRFWLRVDEHALTGLSRVAARGSQVAYGVLAGPTCEEEPPPVVNQPPAALDDLVTTVRNQTISIAVLSNDYDPDGTSLDLFDFAALSDQGGQVARQDPGTPDVLSDDLLAYTPPLEFTGQDTFTYTVSDGELQDSALVQVNVLESSLIPVASPDEYTVDSTALVVPTPGILQNDLIAGEAAEIFLVEPPDNGNLDLDASGAFTYTVSNGFNGNDSFSYYLRANGLKSNSALVVLHIVDQIAPTITWVGPVEFDGNMDVRDGDVVLLEATADDNLAVDRVVFLRWDSVANDGQGEYVTIAEVSQAPYQTQLAVNELRPAWNHILAASFDVAGNISVWKGIWLYKVVSGSSAGARTIFLPFTSSQYIFQPNP